MGTVCLVLRCKFTAGGRELNSIFKELLVGNENISFAVLLNGIQEENVGTGELLFLFTLYRTMALIFPFVAK